ncbi:SMP-30/gluconolactonase/LRE family protein [Variovorax sp. H27-G14]|uniref:SMP-30/gluconolactonase/LRE family protein n=1 Tax=Variovorax sp. H27-G14 TaxID=3111914 RepID=UPI0038FC0AD0
MTVLQIFEKKKNQLGECPVWCERTQRLYWTDIVGQTLFAHDSKTRNVLHWPLPERLGSFALTKRDNVLLLGLASRLVLFDLIDQTILALAPSPGNPGTRIGDGRCDREGNFVFGTMHEAAQPEQLGAFYRLNAASLSVERLALADTAISNGICFSPDGATFYYCDSMKQKISCCDYPSLDNQRTFALVNGNGAPDGSCIDAQGFLWNAEWGGSRVVRYSPHGGVDRVIPAMAQLTTCPAIGGVLYDTLYCTTASIGLGAANEADGALLCANLHQIKGLPEVRFAGC